MYLLYIFPPWAPHTYDFVVLTSLTHPRKILSVVLQIENAKNLSAPLRILLYQAYVIYIVKVSGIWWVTHQTSLRF
jgi:hypothetical protein